jgi:hypothetical protein
MYRAISSIINAMRSSSSTIRRRGARTADGDDFTALGIAETHLFSTLDHWNLHATDFAAWLTRSSRGNRARERLKPDVHAGLGIVNNCHANLDGVFFDLVGGTMW